MSCLVLSDCGGSFVISSVTHEVILSSPNFPKNYPNSSRCTWTIYAPKKNYVYVQFFSIKLEPKYDWLKLCEGKFCSKGSQLAKLSGKSFTESLN